MLWEIGTLAKHVLLPPLLWGWLLVWGWFRFRKYPRAARWSIGIGIVLLYLSATPLVAGFLMGLVTDAAPEKSDIKPQAIVILAGGRSLEFDDKGNVVRGRPGPSTSERLIEGVRLARELQLPVLVSGGTPDGLSPAESIIMRDAMERHFGVAPKWVEAESRNTVENALFSASLLKRDGISRIILVTHGYHMRRARYLFEQFGVSVDPAAVELSLNNSKSLASTLRSLLPTVEALSHTFFACNEMGGILYARLRNLSTADLTPSTGVAK